MTISLSGAIKDGMQAKDLLPVYVLMAKPVSDTEVAAGKQHSEVYRLNRACKLSSFTEFEGWRRAEANFILPEMNKLSLDVKAGKLTILLVKQEILSVKNEIKSIRWTRPRTNPNVLRVSLRLDISSTSALEKKMVSLMSCRCDILNIVPLNLKALNKTRILSPLNDPIHDINKNSKEKMKDDHFA
ncbi:Polycomb group protein EMBRYONIC FLOWER 2 [Vitis vinifera]|uniref:Polycomb group protein EMBRYONIC FLOWER 2 n=1 Tax=Vitis vinifera TaxID=29760 RepID=A0A438K2U0_VITVI|nr:Polycomb group protein EMBRYONIC FLOWER 2 [Vitis vinifera]